MQTGLLLGLLLEATGLWTSLRIGKTDLMVNDRLPMELADCEVVALAELEPDGRSVAQFVGVPDGVSKPGGVAVIEGDPEIE